MATTLFVKILKDGPQPFLEWLRKMVEEQPAMRFVPSLGNVRSNYPDEPYQCPLAAYARYSGLHFGNISFSDFTVGQMRYDIPVWATKMQFAFSAHVVWRASSASLTAQEVLDVAEKCFAALADAVATFRVRITTNLIPA